MVDKSFAEQIRREAETEKKVRSMDAHEIVDWVHRLEDQISQTGDTIHDACVDIDYVLNDIERFRVVESIEDPNLYFSDHFAANVNDLRASLLKLRASEVKS